MLEIKLSEELDRYNTKLFPPQYHYKYLPYKYRLIVDGERWEHSVALKNGSDHRVSALLWSEDVRKVENALLTELGTHFSDLELALSEIRQSPFGWQFDFLELRWPEQKADSTNQVIFKVDRDFEFWSAPFSVAELAKVIQTVTVTHPELGFSYWQRDQKLQKGFGVSRRIPATESVKTILVLKQLVDFENRVEASLASPNLIHIQFNFPESIKHACEQYLIYFVQFLTDLGIDAGAELKEEAQNVLFTVKPKDQDQALSQIWAALRIYLQIPGLADFETASSQFNDVAIYQLTANLNHLKAQIQFAVAQLQMKNATIAAQNAEIVLLKERFDLYRFSESQVSEPKDLKEEEAEPIIPGVVGVRKLVLWDFLEIELPEILRKLKRRS